MLKAEETMEKMQALVNLSQLQISVSKLFVQAEWDKKSGDYRRAQASYGAYVDQSRTYLQEALDFNARFQDPNVHQEIAPIARPLVNALMVYADIEEALGNREAAAALREEALDVSKRHLERKDHLDTERSLATRLILQGRFNEALVDFQKIRDVARTEEDALALARVTIDYADILHWLGDHQRAEEAIVEAEELIAPYRKAQEPSAQRVLKELMREVERIEVGEGPQGTAEEAAELYRAATEVTFYHGLIAKALEKWEEAERCFTEVRPHYREVGAEEAIEFQLAGIQLKRGQVQEALANLTRLAPTFDQGAYRPKRAALQRLQAECFEALGEIDAAMDLVDQSITDLTDTHYDPDQLWRSQGLQARLHAAKGEKDQAVTSYQEAIETITALRRAPLGYRLDSTYLDDKQKLFADAIAKTMEAGAFLASCRLMDSIKSRTLRTVLSIPAYDRDADDRELQFEAVTQQLDSLEYQAYRQGWDGLIEEYRTLLQKRGDLLESLRISDPRWRALTEPVEIDYEALPDALAERGQAVLTVYYAPPILSAVLMVDGSVLGETMTLSDATAANLDDYVDNLQKPSPNIFKHDLSSTDYGVEAQQLVPRIVLEHALDADSLVIIPHGVLHLIPWAGLLYEGKRLFEYLPVGMLPNLSPLTMARDLPKPEQASLLAVPEYEGLPNLPSAQDEVEDIATLYRSAGVEVNGPLLGRDATEARFWDVVRETGGGANVLHISCHGTMVRHEPMYGGLLMFDAKVDAAEIARAHLPFDEVVLSACSTGWRPTQVQGIELTADEILGIPAGFLEAGAEAVLVSIPKAVGRPAQRLTTQYHQRRAAGDAPLRAFQQAQLHLHEDGTEAPGSWVGFTFYGCS